MLTRFDVLAKLRPAIASQLAALEHAVGLEVQFLPLPSNSSVSATYGFDPFQQRAAISLSARWEDVDVAHELVHMQLELVDGFSVVAWRRDVRYTEQLETTMYLLRVAVDDDVVHQRLVSIGLNLYGEVLRPPLFDQMCTTVPKQLRSAASRRADGMAHCDGVGCGDLRRAVLCAQIEQMIQTYSADLPTAGLQRLEDFVAAFKQYREREYRKAQRILSLHASHDVHTAEGHAAILRELISLERVDREMGVSQYVRTGSKYLLPWPSFANDRRSTAVGVPFRFGPATAPGLRGLSPSHPVAGFPWTACQG